MRQILSEHNAVDPAGRSPEVAVAVAGIEEVNQNKLERKRKVLEKHRRLTGPNSVALALTLQDAQHAWAS